MHIYIAEKYKDDGIRKETKIFKKEESLLKFLNHNSGVNTENWVGKRVNPFNSVLIDDEFLGINQVDLLSDYLLFSQLLEPSYNGYSLTIFLWMFDELLPNDALIQLTKSK